MIKAGTISQRIILSMPDFQDRIVAELRKNGIDATRVTESDIEKAFIVISEDKDLVKQETVYAKE